MKPASASCGLTFNCAEDLTAKLRVMTLAGYDFLVTPIIHPRYRLPEEMDQPSSMVTASGDKTTAKTIKREYPISRSCLMLDSQDWARCVAAMISKNLNIESSCQSIRKAAEMRLHMELDMAIHLGLGAIVFEITSSNNANLARIVHSYLLKTGVPGGGKGQVWLKIPLNNKNDSLSVKASHSHVISDVMKDSDSKNIVKDSNISNVVTKINCLTLKESETKKHTIVDTWEWWDIFRGCANTEKGLFLALILDKDAPDEKRLQRWLGEPVKALIVPTSLFLTNRVGCPVLPRMIQAIVQRFVPFKVQYVIEGRSMGHDMKQYKQYMDHLVNLTGKRMAPNPVQSYASGFEDFLQTPLQPLADNLEAQTYEVFEKDPIKYTEYQRAIQLALKERISDEEAAQGQTLILMVLGAGRGPLVRASLKAAELSQRKIKVYAVEKNPNAVNTLRTQKVENWGEMVDVIEADMRELKMLVKADIVISELLGSFGDNELSPECLYDAESLMKPDGISIPSKYTSWIGPIQSSKIYHDVRSSSDAEKNRNASFETPYVVHFQNRTELSKPQPLITFTHPSYGGKIDNTRYEVKNFEISMDSQLHGFAGYFECTLYKDIMISTLPDTHSRGMFSWFPIFFPLRNPIKLRQKDDLQLHFWRLNNKKHVWYEWCITKPIPVPIHNPNARSYQMGL